MECPWRTGTRTGQVLHRTGNHTDSALHIRTIYIHSRWSVCAGFSSGYWWVSCGHRVLRFRNRGIRRHRECYCWTGNWRWNRIWSRKFPDRSFWTHRCIQSKVDAALCRRPFEERLNSEDMLLCEMKRNNRSKPNWMIPYFRSLNGKRNQNLKFF